MVFFIYWVKKQVGVCVCVFVQTERWGGASGQKNGMGGSLIIIIIIILYMFLEMFLND